MDLSLLCLTIVLLSTPSQQNEITVGQYSFMFGPTKRSWFDANDWCNNQQFQLVSIHSETQYNATRLAILQTDPTKSQNYWTGLQRQGTNIRDMTTYSWSDGSPFNYGTTFEIFPWTENQPNSDTDPSCVRLANSYNYLWDDVVDCNSTKPGLKAIPICNAITNAPTKSPTKSPTSIPTETPTKSPIKSPTKSPTKTPTTNTPTTNTPTMTPTIEQAAGVDTITTVIIFEGTNQSQKQTESKTSDIISFPIIITACVIISICCILIIGFLLLKSSKNKRMNKNKNTNVTKEIKEMPKTYMHEHVQTHSEINMELQESIAVVNIRKETDGFDDAIYEPVDIDDGRKVTDGYIDDEHDGIIDANSYKNHNAEMVPLNDAEGGYEMENEMENEMVIGIDQQFYDLKDTPQGNIGNDEFIIKNDDDDDKGVLTPKNNVSNNTKS